jgi:ribose 5-phosphate isomerase A
MAGEEPFRTDEGNFILDLALGRIGDRGRLSLALNQIPGVVENGLFLGLCDAVVIGHGDGRVETRDLHAGTVHEERSSSRRATTSSATSED